MKILNLHKWVCHSVVFVQYVADTYQQMMKLAMIVDMFVILIVVATTMDERELDELFPLTARIRMEKPLTGCPNTIMGRHGPADVYGKCPWCRTKYEQTVKAPHPRKIKGAGVSAYEYHYDPDYGNSHLDCY